MRPRVHHLPVLAAALLGPGAGRGCHGDYRVTAGQDGRRAGQAFTLRPEAAKTAVTHTLP